VCSSSVGARWRKRPGLSDRSTGVGASGTGALNYQWRLNGTNLPGATASSLTLVGSPLKVVFGKGVKLSGLLSQGGAPLAGLPVSVSAEPFGTSTFTNLATVTTSTTGAYSTTTKPKKQTVYQASAAGVTAPPTVTVKVAQRLRTVAAGADAKRQPHQGVVDTPAKRFVERATDTHQNPSADGVENT